MSLKKRGKNRNPSKATLLFLRCFKGCAEWKVSGGGSLFEATEPEGCDCDEVTVEKVDEEFPEDEERAVENCWKFGARWGNWGLSFGNDLPEDMSAK